MGSESPQNNYKPMPINYCEIFIIFLIYTIFLDFNVNIEHVLEVKDKNPNTLFKWG